MKENNIKILDTNVLLDYPQIVTKNDEYWIISIRVLKEIDSLKASTNQEIAKKARKAAVYIAKNMDNIEWDMDEDAKSVDDQLLQITQKHDAVLVTNDIALKVRASVNKIQNEGYSWNEDYTGVKYLAETATISEYNSIIADLEENGYYEPENYTFSKNEYLIVPPPYEDASLGKTTCWKYDGAKFFKVPFQTIKSNWLLKGNEIKPRNPEQICLIDAIHSNSKILYVGGTFGTGKTFCTHHYAIEQLETGKIKKIIYIPNNSYTQNTMDLGALPGDLIEKIQPIIGPLIDIVGIDQVLNWIHTGMVEIVPVAYIRGRNFNDSIIIVSEAENLTEEHIKLLIGRCGEGTRIFFDGDIHQADSSIFKDRNGLKLLLNLHDSPLSHLFSTVKLIRIERSEVAAAADYLDTI